MRARWHQERIAFSITQHKQVFSFGLGKQNLDDIDNDHDNHNEEILALPLSKFTFKVHIFTFTLSFSYFHTLTLLIFTLSLSGTFASFGWDTSSSSVATSQTHLVNQQYNVCIRSTQTLSKSGKIPKPWTHPTSLGTLV